ncbi:amino acid ABC transporter substrate-binding protein [Bacillus sp. FJAT-18017]|uniref:basic amino acid ABC transporter substrate-binding protein n=1 Tax=Bacillus sp. FJAT-18017 TaxID=1705566 RepID=UPI0006AF83BD|nr:basic amino acid ABC transporter substrate-binding protein [Bacillus sp. FJAT-18017]ALC91759.1 amino acid ABC transporter substrate-binding protein [Bacillus sp. FJAT-18017]
MSKKRGILLTILLAISLILAACGTKESATSGSGGKKKLSGGTEAAFAPFESMNDKGEIVGIDVDVLKAIAEEAGFEYELNNVGWEPLFQQITNGELDFGVSGITITDERKETYDFTEPYYQANLVIVVKEDSAVQSVADLKGKKVSVQINTTGHKAAQKALGQSNPDILAYESQPAAMQEVINGSTEAAIGDNAVVYEYLKNNKNAKLKVIEDPSFEKEFYGIMVKKGNKEVLDLLNEGLKKIKENGKLEEITGQKLE